MHVYVCAFVCVRVRERETDGVNVCMHVCEIEKVTKKTVIEGGNGGKRKIFHTSPTSLEPIIQSFSKTVNFHGGAILGCSHKKLLFNSHHAATTEDISFDSFHYD